MTYTSRCIRHMRQVSLSISGLLINRKKMYLTPNYYSRLLIRKMLNKLFDGLQKEANKGVNVYEVWIK